jgi:hypothetical protein
LSQLLKESSQRPDGQVKIVRPTGWDDLPHPDNSIGISCTQSSVCHRLGLIITSSNFPRFAQNPNNGDPFIGGSPPVFVTNTPYLDGMSAIVLAVGP